MSKQTGKQLTQTQTTREEEEEAAVSRADEPPQTPSPINLSVNRSISLSTNLSTNQHNEVKMIYTLFVSMF